MPADFDAATWHAANVGLHGDDPKLAALLFPHRPLAAAVAALRWQDPHTGAFVSDCGIYGLAYVRARLAAAGASHPMLDRDYRNGEAPWALAQIATDLGAWTTDPADLLVFPDPGDVLAVSSPWHCVCVTGSDGPTGNLLAVEGGGGDGREIKAHSHQVTTSGGQLWLHDPAWGSPRASVGRLVAARLP